MKAPSASSAGVRNEVFSELGDEGVTDSREKLLLWLLRNQFDLGPEDSYSAVLDEESRAMAASNIGATIDGLVVIERRDRVVVVYAALSFSADEAASGATQLVTAIESDPQIERRISKLNSRFRALLDTALKPANNVPLDRIVLSVCDVDLTPARRRRIMEAGGDDVEVQVIDSKFIDALVAAERDPSALTTNVVVDVPKSERLNLRLPSNKSTVFAVYATDISTWDGIADRSIFDLNVRHALGLNKVRKSLDKALQNSDDEDEFLAYHNGITAVCSALREYDDRVEIDGISIVNGAQTVVAIEANRERLAEGIRVLLKVVEADRNSVLAKNIAVRSNTQNPVTSRNLRALDEVQARLETEVGRRGYVYVRRPNDSTPVDRKVIKNDDVAQLLCSVYLRKPALSVKRQVLFDEAHYPDIFSSNTTAEQVILAHLVREAVDLRRSDVPALYGTAWALTRLTLVYMTSEAMRNSGSGRDLIERPHLWIEDEKAVLLFIGQYVSIAIDVLNERRENALASERDQDDFKVAFKQTRTLEDLGGKAAKEARRRDLNDLPDTDVRSGDE